MSNYYVQQFLEQLPHIAMFLMYSGIILFLSGLIGGDESDAEAKQGQQEQ